jgi:hypothetical protein
MSDMVEATNENRTAEETSGYGRFSVWDEDGVCFETRWDFLTDFCEP